MSFASRAGGRFLVWDSLFFSLPDNNPLTPKQRLDLVLPPAPLVRTMIYISHAMALPCAIALSLLAIFWLPGVRRWRRAIAENVAPGLAITGAFVVVAAFAGEAYLRVNHEFPVSQVHLDGGFDPEVGAMLKPNGTIKFTNGVDFWVEEKANSLGMADAEPKLPKPAGTFRILIVGASYVAAMQVPLRQKFPTLLASMLQKAYPNQAIDVVAQGFFGSQSNQLPVFQRYKDRVQPDLVLLVFAPTDFANNSVLLHSVRQSWDPRFPALNFFEKADGDRCSRLPISPDAPSHLVPATASARVELFKTLSPDFGKKLAGWDPKTQPMDKAFGKDELPAPVFDEAIDLTKCALAEWKRLGQAEGFKLAVIAQEDVTNYGQMPRLRKLLAELQIPMMDLFAKFASSDPARTRFMPRDAHMNALGHQWTAEEIFAQLVSGGFLPAAAGPPKD